MAQTAPVLFFWEPQRQTCLLSESHTYIYIYTVLLQASWSTEIGEDVDGVKMTSSERRGGGGGRGREREGGRDTHTSTRTRRWGQGGQEEPLWPPVIRAQSEQSTWHAQVRRIVLIINWRTS